MNLDNDENLTGVITTTAANTTITTTTGNTFTIGDLTSKTVDGNSGLIWTYEPSQISQTDGWTDGSSTVQWPTLILEEATKEELQKIIRNQEVQIEIKGEMKTCKLADLLNTGYLTLKSL